MDTTPGTVVQPTLEDTVADGHRRRSEGMARAKANAHPPAWRAAMQTVRYLAALRDPSTGEPKAFTADDLHDHGHSLGNAMGSLFGEARRDGIIEAVQVPGMPGLQIQVPSRRPELHRAHVGLWRGVA